MVDNRNLQIRQGDVFLKAVGKVAPGARLVTDPKASPGETILAHGEVTGHKHRFQGGVAQMLETPDQRRFVKVETTAPLVHEEHATINVPAGTYEVKIQQEYVDKVERARPVID